MKPKRLLPIFGMILLLLCLLTLIAGGAGYVYLQNRPPSVMSDSGYYIRGSKIYYHPGFPGSPVEVTGADADSFTILDVQYATDRAHVYINGGVIEGADPVTFEPLDDTFTRDANHVYLGSEIFSDDPVNFEHVENNIYRDSQHIYWSTTNVSDDPSKLVILGSSGFYTYFKDSTTVFIQGNPIQAADPATFSIISDAYSRDASSIFYFDQIVPEADSASLEIISPPYARDAARVYFMEQILRDADPATFLVLNVDFQCSADATHAYYQGLLIPNFDPAEIPSNAIVTNCDANGIYTSP